MRHTFIGGTRHGEPAPDTPEDRIVAINDGTVYLRRSLSKTAEDGQVLRQHDFFVFEALSVQEALIQAEPYWDGPAPQM